MNLADRIRLGFDRFNARDWDLIARGLPDRFEAVDHLDERRARGPDAFRQITTANGDQAFADLRMEPSEIIVLPAKGDRTDVLVRILARPAAGRAACRSTRKSRRSGRSNAACP